MAAGFYAYTLCNVLFLTGVWRYSILEAGLALTPGPFVAMAVAGPASRLVERVGHRARRRAGRADLGARAWRTSRARSASTPTSSDEWLPGMRDPRHRRRAELPDAERRCGRLGAGPALRRGAPSLNSVARQLGAALGVAILIAIIGNPERVRCAARVPARLAVRGRVLSRRRGRVPRRSCVRRAARATAPRRRRRPRTRRARSPNRAAAPPALPSLAESDGEHADVAPQTVAEFLRNVPVFAGLSSEPARARSPISPSA